jgi:hypothetical protein
MARVDKTLARMQRNPKGWRIEDLKRLAARFDIDWRQPGTSHVTFSYPGLLPVTVPSHKPIKPIYVRQFLRLIGQVQGEVND